MLIEFSVKNFKVFKQKATLSMVAHKPYKEHPETLITPENFDNIQLSRTAVIYGANGSGKSSLVEAFWFFRVFINNGEVVEYRWQPFAMCEADDVNNDEIEFELMFIGNDGLKYHYGVSYSQHRIESEFLLSFASKGRKARTIFSRVFNQDENGYDFYYPSLDEHKVTIELTIEKANLNPKRLYLNILEQYEVQQVNPFFSWLDVLTPISYESYDRFREEVKQELIAQLQDKASGDEVKQNILRFLNQFDLSLKDIELVKTSAGVQVFLHHQVPAGQCYSIHYDEMSSGSKKLFDLAILLIRFSTSSNFKVLVLDEIESSFHPHILQTLYQQLAKSNSNSQLIATTHSTTLLDPELIRRDQIWFVEKSPELCSELYSLMDFSPTVNENLAKGWLNGRYGAVPFIAWE